MRGQQLTICPKQSKTLFRLLSGAYGLGAGPAAIVLALSLTLFAAPTLAQSGTEGVWGAKGIDQLGNSTNTSWLVLDQILGFSHVAAIASNASDASFYEIFIFALQNSHTARART